MAEKETTTALAIRHLPYQGMGDLVQVGSLLAQSGFFGIRNQADGFVVAATCHQKGMSLLEFSETYHIVEGKPSMRADAMLARLIELGGEYEIFQRDDKGAAIKAKFGKALGVFALSWDEAQAEPFPWRDSSKKELKKNWATPRARKQMMWARVVSDAVRTVCPLAVKGTYTPEEVQDFADPADRDAIPTAGKVVDVSTVQLPTAPIEAQPNEPATQQQASNATPEREDPFKRAEAQKQAAQSFNVCPVECGGGTLGKEWTSFDDATLGFILQNSAKLQQQFPAITNDHLEYIRGCMQARTAGGNQ